MGNKNVIGQQTKKPVEGRTVATAISDTNNYVQVMGNKSEIGQLPKKPVEGKIVANAISGTNISFEETGEINLISKQTKKPVERRIFATGISVTNNYVQVMGNKSEIDQLPKKPVEGRIVANAISGTNISFEETGEINLISKQTKKPVERRIVATAISGTNNYVQVTSDINVTDKKTNENILPSTSPRETSIWFEVIKPVESFTGRRKEIENLHKEVQRNFSEYEHKLTVISEVTSISGLGGIGKSEIARMYARQHGPEYGGNVIWINAETYDTLTESFNRLANKLNISTKSINGQEKDIHSIVNEVYNYFTKKKSLFIFDNAQKLRTETTKDEGIDKFLPKYLSINDNEQNIIITSRNQKWGDKIKVLSLGTFTEEEAIEFIKKDLHVIDESQGKEICKLAQTLQCFPLALQQAVAYIKQTDDVLKNVRKKFKINDYLKRYEEKAIKLLDFKYPEDSSRYFKTTFITLKVTIEKIKQKEYGQESIEVLETVAYFAPDKIPTNIFLELVNGDEEKMVSILQLPKQYSIFHLEQSVLNIHKLVQQVIRLILKEQQKEKETLRRALKLIKTRLEEADADSSKILPHAISAWNYSTKDEIGILTNELIEFSNRITYKLINDTRYQEAHTFAIQTLELLKNRRPSTLNTSFVIENQSTHEIFQEVSKLTECELGAEHPSTLLSKNNMAKLLSLQSKYEQALNAFQEVFKIQERVLGGEHPDTLTTSHNIALVLDEQSKYAKPLEIINYQDVLNIRERVLGGEHPNILITRHNENNHSLNSFSEKLNAIFENKIKLSFVSAKSVIIVTIDDKCYEFTRNYFINRIKNALIALSDDKLKVNSLIEESFVEKLSYKKVIDFKNGCQHLIARTINGKVYCWGRNIWGVLGNGKEDWETYEPEPNQVLVNENIIDMCCGLYHTLVLTINGEVYAWGWNCYGQIGNGKSGFSEYQSTPLILKAFNDEKVTSISCGLFHSLALTENGRVYSWGANACGQLGIGTKTDSFSPKLLELSEQLNFEKISCGFVHSLLISHENDIFVCGLYRSRELTTSDRDIISTPKMLSHSQKFTDIASHFNDSFSAAISLNKKFKSLNDMFVHYLKITFNPIEGKVIRFEDDFIRNGEYENHFIDEVKIEGGNYGEVFRVCAKNSRNIYAIKKMKCKTNELIKELETFSLIAELNRENFVHIFDIWLENDFIYENGIKTYNKNFILYIQMELCDKSLTQMIAEMKNDLKFCSKKLLSTQNVRKESKETVLKSFKDIFENYFQPIEGKVIRFKDDFIQNSKYKREFIEKESLGRGSFGEVFEANEKYNKDKYAIKVIKFTEKHENFFLKEMKNFPTISQLRNENIVKYFNVWLENDENFEIGIKPYINNFILYIQMELCDEYLETIIDEIKSDSNIYSKNTLKLLGYYIASEIFIEILEGVNYLHTQNPPIIHRDLNPRNIMLKIDDNCNSLVKIVDFGLATVHEYSKQSHTENNGSHKYMAPEVSRGRNYDTRADIYSTGIIVEELFDIDINRDYEKQVDILSPLLMSKYQNLSNISNKMTARSLAERTKNVGEILDVKHLWALSANEFEVQIDSNVKMNSYVYKLLNKRLSIS